MTGKPTVFVVDDDPGALRSLCWLIQQADLPVRAFRSGREFLESYRPEETGCLVLDVRMPEMGGLEVQQRLGRDGIGLPIIFITAHGDVPTCAQAFKGGAFDFLEKPVDDETLITHIQQALAHNAEQKCRHSTAEHGARLRRLTPVEKAVLESLISGKSLKEIATLRNVTIQTTWRHRASILRKLGVENDVQLVQVATQRPPAQRRPPASAMPSDR
jgi:FixJ family two-component response regulator